jgi:DNA-binding HxlR family transcriptional regulator
LRSGTPDHEWREDCAPRRMLEIFETKGTTMILYVLYLRFDGCARTGTLHRGLPGISKKMLTQTLRDMEASGLLTRYVHGIILPAVDDTLTPLRRRLIEPIEWLYEWARKNPDALDGLGVRASSRRR